MTEETVFDGKTYISSKRASQLSGYSQDYIGQLSRSGALDSRRVGGLWFVTLDSVQAHEKKSNEERSENARSIMTRADRQDPHQDTVVGLDGKEYISAIRASNLSGYSQDYVGQLARSGKVASRQVGNRWYVERESLLAHKAEKDSLLAAVQRSSVGLTVPDRVHKEELRREPVPVMNYYRESEDLLPLSNQHEDDMAAVPTGTHHISISIESENSTDNNSNIKDTPSVFAPDKTMFEAKKYVEDLRIQTKDTSKFELPTRLTQDNILILRPQTSIAKKSDVGSWRRTLGLLSASALTVVVVVSLGFETVRSQASYTAATSTPHARLSALAGTVIDTALTALENALVPMLHYSRSENH